MSTFMLRRFTSQETLKSVREEHLLALLERYRSYFAERGVSLTSPRTGLRIAEPMATYGNAARYAEVAENIDYEGIARVLMSPDEKTPRDLVDDLFFIDEMSTPEAMDELREEIAKLPPARRQKLEVGPDPTPADVAVMIRLHAPDILEHKHAEGMLTSRRSFQYFRPAEGNSNAFQMPTDEQLRKLEAALDDAFDEMKRGRSARIHLFERRDEVWLLIRRGDPFKREGSVESSGSASVYYRPEVFDVIRLDGRTGELSINAGGSAKLYNLYREKIGLHLFGDAFRFPATARFTLDPLRAQGEEALVCTDIEGMESVVLKEVHYFWGGPEKEIEVRKASNLFEALKRRGKTIPENARITKAKFEMKFADAKRPRMVTISDSNVTSFTRDSDTAAVEEWMVKRGFAEVAGE